MKIPELFCPECKQSLRLIMRRQSETKTVTFSVLVTSVDESFGSKKKKSTNGFKKFISTESQEEGKLNAAA